MALPDAELAPFAYAAIRIVPRVEREEFINAGVVLFARSRRMLGVRTHLDPERLLALWPAIDLEGVRRQLHILQLVAAGDPAGGAIAALTAAERFGWMTAPASTIVQPGPVHGGLARDPEAALDELFGELVLVEEGRDPAAWGSKPQATKDKGP